MGNFSIIHHIQLPKAEKGNYGKMSEMKNVVFRGALTIALATLFAGCLKHPKSGRAQLEPGWVQSEMLVMSFNLKGEGGAAAIDGLAETITAQKPRYVALQDIGRAQADALAKKLGMRADWCGSGADQNGPSGVALLSRGERVLNVWTAKDALELPWVVNNKPKAMPKSAISIQFAEHNVTSVLLDDSPGAAAGRVEALNFVREVPRNRPPVFAFALGADWKGDTKLCALYDKRYRTCSPEDAAADTLISTAWNFASQFGLAGKSKVAVKGFGDREAVLAKIKY